MMTQITTIRALLFMQLGLSKARNAIDVLESDIGHRVLSAHKKHTILFRAFPPISAPAEYRHEAEEGWDRWTSGDSCASCLYHTRSTYNRFKHCIVYGPFGCKFYYSWEARSEWCRFTEYRTILFRRFEMEEL